MLLRRIRRGVPASEGSGLRLSMGDDAALWRSRPGYEVVLTTDWFLEGVHFLGGLSPAEAVGWKCLARAASDLAAMGAQPRCFLLSLAIPKSKTRRWLDGFLTGLRRAAQRLGCALAGGDTTRSEKAGISVSVVGEVRKGRAVLRSGARPGEVIYVSGRLGEAALGLRLLRRGEARTSALLRRHFYPEPRLALGQWLAEKRLASAMMDLSDGLSSDLPRICRASGAGARIVAEKIPTVRNGYREAAARIHANPLELALDGGDDYELLFTVPQRLASKIPSALRGVPLTAIGEITSGRNVVLVGEAGEKNPLRPAGWDPFR